MSDPYIQVSGKGNRVAGRDYHEHHYPELCTYCELRYLSQGRSYCRHCEMRFEKARQQQIILERKKRRKRIADRVCLTFALLALMGLLLNRYGPDATKDIALSILGVSALCALVIFRIFGN